MARTGAYISDVKLLESLNDRIRWSGENMANIDQGVCNYLGEVMSSLQSDLNYIQSRLGQAESSLSQAQSALNACQASQAAAAAMGVMGPSCMMEESAVQAAQAEVAKWRGRYEHGQQIVAECSRETGEYNGSGGGHALIQNMCNTQTPKASQLLNDCVAKLQDILGTDVGSSSAASAAGVGAVAGAVAGGATAKAMNDKFGKFNMGSFTTPVGQADEPWAVLSKNLDPTTAAKWKALHNNNKDLAKALGIKQGPPMTTAEADMQKANPHYGEKKEYGVNCATASTAYALRMRGFDVTAKGNPGTVLRHWYDINEDKNYWISNGDNVFKVWKNADGSEAEPIRTADWMKDNSIAAMTSDDYKKFFDETCKEKGIYILSLGWKGGGGHATILQRDSDGKLSFIEPQVFEKDITSDGRRDVNDILSHINNGESGVTMYPRNYDGIMRVDDKLFNTKYANLFDVNK